jgi:hypothetical protein
MESVGSSETYVTFWQVKMIIFMVSAVKTQNSLFYSEKRDNMFFRNGG